MSSSVAGLPSDPSTVGTKSNGAGELAGGSSGTRLSNSFSTSHSTNGRERTPITASRRSPERRRQTRSPALQRRKSLLPDFDARSKQQHSNVGNGDSDSEAETVVPSPEKRRIQRKRSRSLSPSSRTKSKREVIETGAEVRKRRIEGEEPTQRNEDERLKRLRKDDRTNGPIDNRKHSVQRIKRDYEAYSSDLSSAPSSPPPGSKLKSGTKRLLYSRSRRRSTDSSSEDDEDDDERSGVESSVTGRSSLGAPGRNGHGNDGSSRLASKTTQATDMGPSRTRLRRPPPLKPPPREQSESSRESSPTYRTHTRNGSSLNTPAAAMPKKDGDAMGRTALHKACQRGKLEDAQKAFELKPSLLNQTDNAGYVPLHEAALNGKANCVKYLLDVGCKVDPLGGQDKDTPLMDAVENKHVDVVELLLEAGADPRLRDVKGRNALDLAKGLDESSGDDEEDSTRYRLISLIRSAMEKLRGSSKKTSNDERRQSVVDSASSRDQSVASPVHQSYPEIASNPIGRRRARTGKDILWLEGGKTGHAHLKKFARKGELEKVSIMLEQAITPDEEILKEAIKGGHEDVVSILLAYGAPADPLAGIKQSESRNPDGLLDPESTPMLVCIGRGNLKILQLVLNSVNPRWKDRKGRTYMDIAREREGENYEEEIAMLQRAWDASEAKGSNGVKEESSSRGRTSEKQQSKRKRTSPARKPNKPATLPSKASKSSMRANSDDDSSSDETTSGLPKASHADSVDNKAKKKKKERSPSPDEEHSSPVVRKRRRLVSAGGREVSRKSQAGDSDEEMVNVDKTDKKKPVKTEKRVKSAAAEESPAKAPALRSASTSKVKIKKEETPEPKVASRKRVPDIPAPTPSARESGKREHKTPKSENKDPIATPKAKKEKETDTDVEVKKERKKERLVEKEDRRNSDDSAPRKSGRVSELKGKEDNKARRDSVSKPSTTSTSSKSKEPESAKATLKRLNVPVPEPKLRSPTPSLTKPKENVKEPKKERSAVPAMEPNESEQVQSDKEKAAAEKAAVEKAERKLRRREEQRRIKAEEERKAAEEAKKLQEEIDRARTEHLAQELASTLEKAKSDREKSRLEQEKERENFFAEQERKMQEEQRRREEAEEAKRKAEEVARVEAARQEAERAAERARLAEEARIEALPETLQELARQNDNEVWTLDGHRRWCTPFTISLLQGATEITEDSLKAAYGKFGQQEKWVLNTQVALALGLKDLSLKKFDQFITARLPASRDILSRVWRMCSMDYCVDTEAQDRKVIIDYHANHKELQRAKFEAINDAFFIKLDDLRQIVRKNPEYAELANQKLCTQGMVLYDIEIPANQNPWDIVRQKTPPADDLMW